MSEVVKDMGAPSAQKELECGIVSLYIVKPSNTTYKIYWLQLDGRPVSVSNDHLQAIYNKN